MLWVGTPSVHRYPLVFNLGHSQNSPESSKLVQIAGEERPGTCHLQRLPQTFLGLVQPIFVRLQGANDPFRLAALAPDRLVDGLGNVPRPCAFGLNANRLDPVWLN